MLEIDWNGKKCISFFEYSTLKVSMCSPAVYAVEALM